MRKIGIVATVLAALVVMAGAVFGAANPKGGLPTASFDGASVTVTGGEFSGLGNIPAFATLTVNGQATYECQNPTGHTSPGQNPVEAQPGNTGPVQLPTDKNGRATIPSLTASITAPPTPTAQQVGCGGKGSTAWTVVLTGLQATSAHLVITHGDPGPVIFCRDYTLNGPATGTAC